jgi:hypothetical protein
VTLLGQECQFRIIQFILGSIQCDEPIRVVGSMPTHYEVYKQALHRSPLAATATLRVIREASRNFALNDFTQIEVYLHICLG